MSAIPVFGGYGRRKYLSPFFSDSTSASIIRVMTALIVWLLVAVHLLMPSVNLYNFNPNFYLFFGTIIWCWKICGRRIFTKTPIDFFFLAWLLLAVTSQVYAGEVLHRVVQSDDLISYLRIILTLWFGYRAAYGLTIVDPVTAGGAFLKAIVFFLGFACIIGILQGVGPFKTQAISIGQRFGASGDAVQSAVEMQSPRPIALFSGPNFFGFMNLIACTAIVALTMYKGKAVSAWAIAASVFGLCLFVAGTVVAQSRAALAACLLLVCYFLYLMLRIGRVKIFVTGVVAICIAVLGGVYLISNLQLDYLQSTFSRKIQDDGSFMERERGLSAFFDQAEELAPIGSGWTSRAFSLDRTGDKYSKTNSIDNGFIQAYINHGVPGVVHLLFLFFGCYLAIRASKGIQAPHVRLVRICAIMMLGCYFIYSISGVRHAKLETGVYWMFVFGILWALVHLDQRRMGRARQLLALDSAPIEQLPAQAGALP